MTDSEELSITFIIKDWKYILNVLLQHREIDQRLVKLIAGEIKLAET